MCCITSELYSELCVVKNVKEYIRSLSGRLWLSLSSHTSGNKCRLFPSSRHRCHVAFCRHRNYISSSDFLDINATNVSARLGIKHLCVFSDCAVCSFILFFCLTLPKTLFPRVPSSVSNFLRGLLLEAVLSFKLVDR